MIVEADEYDRSFLQLNPDIAVVTSANPTFWIFNGNENELLNNFIQFTHK
jgi:UDP-N-acetylmuramate--alanine ligase